MDVTRRIGLLDESYRVRFDMDYWCRMVSHGFVPQVLPRFLSGFRLVDGQKSAFCAAQSDRELLEIIARYRDKRSLVSRVFSPICLWKARRQVMLAMQRLGVRRYRCQLGIPGMPAGRMAI
jgi:hypothetical protein